MTFEDAVVALQKRTGWDRLSCERAIRRSPQFASVAAPEPVRDENVQEKAEQVEIRKIAITYGFTVRNNSQARPSRVAFGIPDLILVHKRCPIFLWWEVKRGVGGKRSTPQVEFGDDMIRCGIGYGYGDRYAFVEKLIELEIAVRGAGAYGIEPVRHLTIPGARA